MTLKPAVERVRTPEGQTEGGHSVERGASVGSRVSLEIGAPVETSGSVLRREQSRARYPDRTGFVDRDGIKVFYEVYGEGEPAILFMPTWSIVPSRVWKLQIPTFARGHRVITFDPRGNGRSDRPMHSREYDERVFAADALAVLDATGTDRAVVVTLSMGAMRGLYLAADHPERVAGTVFIGPATSLGNPAQGRTIHPFSEPLDTDEGWAMENEHFWRRDFRAYLEFFFANALPEAHSTKPIEDAVGWGLDIGAEALIASVGGHAPDRAETLALVSRIRCPTLVIQGSRDGITGPDRGRALAAALGTRIEWIEGGGHLASVRDPVRVNQLLRDFIDAIAPGADRRLLPAGTARPAGAPRSTEGALETAAVFETGEGQPPVRRWTRSLARPRRVLYVSSPIGLGHAQRDVSIAAELRRLRPEIEIDWLAQHPVTAVLDQHRERLHPASADLALESAHIRSESSGHSLNAFQAIRRMDEILAANFMVFHDAVRDGEYDLVIGDEAWDVDYYLHENPELKRTAYAWLTDFVGWLPMPSGGDREARLTTDYNAEMIEHIARHPRIRDRAIFVGDPGDIVPDTFGPGLPAIRAWTEGHYSFSGYVTGFDPAPILARREEIRAGFGYRPDEQIVIVTVGGSGVGEALLRKMVDAYPAAKRAEPGLRMIVVAGPRIDPASLGEVPGVEVRAYVPELYRHLAVCDLAVVQGGLTTTMELVAAGRPFIYFPLANHFEQNRHVAHRLARHGAGRRMDFEGASPDELAAAMTEELRRPVSYRPVATDGGARAAALIAELM